MSVWIGGIGLGLTAATSAYTIYNSEQQKKKMGAGGGGGMDKKHKKYLNQVANETLQKQEANIAKFEAAAKAAADAYSAAGLGLSNTYDTRTKETVADYDEGNLNLEARSTMNANALAERSKTLGEDTANQALTYNTSKMQDYIAFADALSTANAKSAQRMLFANNPGLEKQQQQALLLSEQQMGGMLSSGTQAMLSRRAAQMGGMSGTGYASDMRKNLELRDLGLTTEQQAQQGFNNYRALRSDIYDQTVAGRQVGSEKIMDFMGLNTSELLKVNQQNNLAQYTAGQNTLDIRQTGLKDILATRSRFNEVDYTQQMGMQGNLYEGRLSAAGTSAELGYKSFSDWGNLRSGGVIQGWANENSRAASNATRNAANTKAVTDTVASTAALGLDFYKTYRGYNSNSVNSYGSQLGAQLGTNQGSYADD
jgi:cell fate (sporulation/competence/biofilm development) regulator YlbF (YheA/YmcA/DUF963 family)